MHVTMFLLTDPDFVHVQTQLKQSARIDSDNDNITENDMTLSYW